MTKLFLTTALTALVLSPAAAQHAGHAAPAKPMAHSPAEHALHAALASPTRPAEDKARDPVRKPVELLTLADVKPGASVVDFIMGGGYWTRILSEAVGPKGKVYAYQPAEFIRFMPKYGTDQDAAVKDRANVMADRQPLASLTVPPASVDTIITVQNWHDLHLSMVPPTFAAGVATKLFAALKPGGVLLVVDHAGAAGQADSLHRGDKAGTIAEITAAGFRLAAESPLYANSADPKTASVFDPEIKGKTDQFVLKFVKPR